MSQASSDATRPSRRRLQALFVPPWALLRLWREPHGAAMRLSATLGLLLWMLFEMLALLTAVLWLTPVDLEWEGGFPPVLTWRKTQTDYRALEAHRAQQAPIAEAALPRGSTYWSGFRGPRREGVYLEQPVNTQWPAEGPPLLWRQPVGGGYASFAVARGRAFTIEQRRDEEAIVAYELETGRELWAQAYPARFDESMGGEGPRATPAWCDGRVFALGATGWLHCLEEANGAMVWRTNILDANDADNLHWAQSASPLTVGDLVIVSPGGRPARAVVAYEQSTGRLRWQGGQGEAAYSSPMLADLLGEEQLIVAVKDRVLGMQWTDGTSRWEFPWRVQQNNANIAQPVVVATNRLVLSAGYGTGSVAVDLSRQGDQWSAAEGWRSRQLKNKFSSSILFEGHLYGLDESILACLEADTGRLVWKEGRYGYGQIVLAGGCLIILCGDGDLALVRATPEAPQVISRFPALPGKTWNHPALAEGILLVRNAVEMAAYDLRVRVSGRP